MLRQLLILLFLPLSVFGQERYQRVFISAPDHSAVEQIAAAGITIDHIIHHKGEGIIAEISETEVAILHTTGFDFEILVEDLSRWYVERNQEPSEKALTSNGNCDPAPVIQQPVNFSLGSMGGFFTYQEMLDQLDSMKAKYPNLITTRQPIGSFTTTNGNSLYWVRISDNAAVDENEPEVLYNALHHAREPASLSQTIFFMWYVLENYDTDPQIKLLTDNLELYFVPCINPDGYLYNESTNPNGGGMWRKNRRNNGNGTFGVDLNRNYGYAWGYDNIGSSGNTNSDVYRGPSAFSEPETQAMKHFCETHQFVSALNYHTYGDLLIYPWGYEESIYTPDSALFVEHARLLTQDNHYHYGTGDQTVGYVTNGDSDDWMYGEQTTKNKIISMTPEAGLASDGFWPQQSRIIPICKVNVTQNLMLAQLALKYARVQDLSNAGTNQLSFYLPVSVKNLGLSPGNGNFTISLSPLQNVLSTSAPITMNAMSSLEVRTDSFLVTLPTSLAAGSLFKLILNVDNGMYLTSDTITKIFSKPDTALFSDASLFGSTWSTTNWSVTSDHFYSVPSSFTDSDGGNYLNNTNNFLTLEDPVDLSDAGDALLRFRAWWDIESGYDHVRVQASTDGAQWTSLCGRYTKPSGQSWMLGEPIYDGVMERWVEEQISLQDYLGNETVYIRFYLRSDAFVTGDGYYVDDLLIETYPDGLVSFDEHKRDSWSLYPNPATDYLKILVPSVSVEESLQVFNQVGQIIIEVRLSSGLNTIALDQIPAGIYFLKGETKSARLVVVK